MDTLAYFHLATAYDDAMDSSSEPSPVFPGLQWSTLSSAGWLLFLSLGLILGVLSLTEPAMALRQGDRGQAVIALQQKLKHLGYFHANVTGYYGPMTVQAVRDYQCAKGLPAIGVAGPQTHRALGLADHSASAQSQDCNCAQPVAYRPPRQAYKGAANRKGVYLTRGSQGQTVVHVQDLLAATGYFHGHSTGLYGPATEESVKSFQRSHGLKVDGIVGPKTYAALNYAFHD